MSTDYSLEFVNEGKPFKMPKWTLDKHEALLEEMIPFEEQKKLGVLTEKQWNRIWGTHLILSALHDIDPKVTEQDLRTLHPDDYITLYNDVYNSGRTGIVVNNNMDFQKREKKSPPQ